jgi:predicted nucleic-acid-binding protein
MIGLDTNVLVRFLVEDDAEQTARATRLIERASRSGDALHVSDVVLCEVVWVMQSAYEVTKPEIVRVIASLLRTRQLLFDDADLLVRALDRFAKGKGDFADYVIAERASKVGSTHVATFNRALLKESGFALP